MILNHHEQGRDWPRDLNVPVDAEKSQSPVTDGDGYLDWELGFFFFSLATEIIPLNK